MSSQEAVLLSAAAALGAAGYLVATGKTAAAAPPLTVADAQAPAAATAPKKKAVEFYRRVLPELCIDFQSTEGRAIFAEALTAGTMHAFFPLIAQFRTQDEPAFCGLGTLVMTLNALAIDPGRVWKGPWRWYAESMLNCCKDLETVQKEGIDFDEFLCLARCNGVKAESIRAEESDIAAFRAAVKRCSAPTAGQSADAFQRALVCSYTRKVLKQTGDGHYSPVGGYHEGRDLVLMLDVARFKYPPHWVPLETVFRAMTPHDKGTGRSRGWAEISPSTEPSMVLFRLNGLRLSHDLEGMLERLSKQLTGTHGSAAAEAACACAPGGDGATLALICTFIGCIDNDTASALSTTAQWDCAALPDGSAPTCTHEHASEVHRLTHELQGTALFRLVSRAFAAGSCGCAAHVLDTQPNSLARKEHMASMLLLLVHMNHVAPTKAGTCWRALGLAGERLGELCAEALGGKGGAAQSLLAREVGVIVRHLHTVRGQCAHC